ncbi:MAG: hypothetical protein CSA66_07515 [Proteobacteria bacterium]|nr:MAG: hypothetical protein CSA66_07515 [Pseudomonadota bacterium]
MEQNIILAGVGGQGILTIARAIGIAALRRGLHIKQAEEHGMAQRGGAVQSHLRLSDRPICSDLIPMGQGDMVIGLDPLESLRYVQYLREDGAIIASSSAHVNISNYPPIEGILERIAAHAHHVFFDGAGLSRAAGSGRAANVVALGAASYELVFDARELEDAIVELFEAKGERVVNTNLRAFRFGANFAAAYRDAVRRGGTPRSVRHWLSTLPDKAMAPDTPSDSTDFQWVEEAHGSLSAAEAHAFDRILLNVYESERQQLYEHEVYTLVQLVGAIAPPRHVFLLKGESISAEQLEPFGGDKVVLKIVAPEIVHKSDSKAVRFVRRDAAVVQREIERMTAQFSAVALVDGILVVEFVPEATKGFGSELFVGIRATREFGPVIAAGIGGLQTEYLAQRMRPQAAVATAVASEVSAEEFLALFRETAAYEVLLGKVRGLDAAVTEGELLRCFRAFILMARQFCVDRGAEGPDILELEVNPFAFRDGRMVPLDGRGRLLRVWGRPKPRPIAKVQRLLEPDVVGVLGVSATARNFGRIILDNLLASGFPAERLVVVKDGVAAIDGVRCVPHIAALPDPTDLLVVAARAGGLPEVIAQIGASSRVRSAILVSGGVGETEGSEAIEEAVTAAIAACRDGATLRRGARP